MRSRTFIVAGVAVIAVLGTMAFLGDGSPFGPAPQAGDLNVDDVLLQSAETIELPSGDASLAVAEVGRLREFRTGPGSASTALRGRSGYRANGGNGGSDGDGSGSGGTGSGGSGSGGGEGSGGGGGGGSLLPELPDEIPLPDLPDVPEVPLPDLPGVPLPDLPGVPLPDVPGIPLPDLPGIPLPDLPDAPLPDLPDLPLP